MKPPDIAVLIVAYRSRRTIRAVTDALNAQTVRPAQIIVLENGSPQGERIDAACLPEAAELVVSERNLGFAGGNNHLARRASADWLVLLNPDAYPDPRWLEELQAAIGKYPDAALFGSTQWTDAQRATLDGAGDVWHAFGIPYRGGYGQPGPPPAAGETFAACGAAMMVRRDVFEALGGFDEDYFCYVEDVDLGYRARLAGHRIIQLREAEVIHEGFGSSEFNSEFAFRHGVRNRFWTFLKCTPLPWLALLTPFHAACTLMLWFFAVRDGRGALFASALGEGVRRAPEIWRKRRAIHRGRSRPATPLWRIWAWSPGSLRNRAPKVI